jgi:hypothetical protein
MCKAMLAQYTYFKGRVKTIRRLPDTLNLAIMLVLHICYCLIETAPLGYTKSKVQCSSRNVLVIQLCVSRILIHYLVQKVFAKKVAQFDVRVERRRLYTLPCHRYFSSGYIFAHAQAEVLEGFAHYLYRVFIATLTTRSQPESSS